MTVIVVTAINYIYVVHKSYYKIKIMDKSTQLSSQLRPRIFVNCFWQFEHVMKYWVLFGTSFSF